MSEIEARILTEPEYNQWDQLVERSEQGTIFHSSKWITTAAKLLYSDYVIIGVFNNSDLIGGCSFYINDLFHFYKRGITNIPLTPYGGLILSLPKTSKVRASEQKEHEIISAIIERIQTFNLFKVNLINSPGLTDIRPFTWRGWRERVYYTYLLSLDNDIFSYSSHSVRKNIKKSQKMGITVKKENNPDIYWKLIKSTYDKQNIKVPFKKEYFFNLLEMLLQNNLGEMWIAWTPNGEPASADVIIWDNKQVYRWMAAKDEQFMGTGATSYLLFEIILDLQKRGFHQINLMSANMINLATFTSGFNPKTVPYYSVENNFLNLFPLKNTINLFYKKIF